ncbi:MAG: DUF4129 domain-containing protein [Actinobacteria bacterium]|nr:MAG: DUF4129 domain-containing protein [Actinomycetota bacterium]
MTPSAEQARVEARQILSERRFKETKLPRPLHAPLEWLGDRLRTIGHWLDVVLPGGGNVVWLVLATLALLFALVVARRLAGMRGPGMGRQPRRGGEPAIEPDELERRADDAERAGELERALRLRRVLDDPASATTGLLVRRLRSEPFARAALSFDEVVYGRRAPTADDARLAREGWEAVLGR